MFLVTIRGTPGRNGRITSMGEKLDPIYLIDIGVLGVGDVRNTVDDARVGA
jgi:hypothetical protein